MITKSKVLKKHAQYKLVPGVENPIRRLPRGLRAVETALGQAAERLEGKVAHGYGDNYDSNDAALMRRAIDAIRFRNGAYTE